MELVQQYRVHPPQKALSRREMTNYLSTLLLWPDDSGFIADAFNAVALSLADGIDAALAACKLVLLGAGLAHDHWVNDFEVRGVRRKRQVHLIAIELTVR